MKTYTAKLKSRAQMERDIPPQRMGWWRDVCPGATMPNLRDATKDDIDRCVMGEGSSRNPDDYLCENAAGGALVSREAIAVLTPNDASTFEDRSGPLPQEGYCRYGVCLPHEPHMPWCTEYTPAEIQRAKAAPAQQPGVQRQDRQGSGCNVD